MTNNLDQTLMERSCRYGAFADVAARTARIYHHMVFNAPQFASKADLSAYYEALHMIAMKIARLVNGNLDDADSWFDIAGYAMLVHNQIKECQEAVNAAGMNRAAKQKTAAKAEPIGLDIMENQITKELQENHNVPT